MIGPEDDIAAFVRVAREEEFAEGQGRTVEAAGRWIALFRIGDAFYAVDNACPHMAGPLGAGRLDGFAVTCPLHHWRIDVRTGRSPTNEHVRVARFETRVEDGWVLIRISPPSGAAPKLPDSGVAESGCPETDQIG